LLFPVLVVVLIITRDATTLLALLVDASVVVRFGWEVWRSQKGVRHS
jgi:hypothetical protein